MDCARWIGSLETNYYSLKDKLLTFEPGVIHRAQSVEQRPSSSAANQYPYVFLSDTGWHDLQFYRKYIHRIESYPRYAAFADFPCFLNLEAFEQVRPLTLSTTYKLLYFLK